MIVQDSQSNDSAPIQPLVPKLEQKVESYEQNRYLEWFLIFMMMILTYGLIVLIWWISWIGIEKDFSTSVYSFMGAYLLLVIVTSIAWWDGISKREDLIKLLIQEKVREEAIEDEKKFNPLKV